MPPRFATSFCFSSDSVLMQKCCPSKAPSMPRRRVRRHSSFDSPLPSLTSQSPRSSQTPMSSSNRTSTFKPTRKRPSAQTPTRKRSSPATATPTPTMRESSSPATAPPTPKRKRSSPSAKESVKQPTQSVFFFLKFRVFKNQSETEKSPKIVGAL